MKNVKVIKIPLTKITFGDFRIAKFQYFKIKKIIKDADAVFTQTIGPIGIASILAAKNNFKPLISFIHNIEWELFPKAITMSFIKKPVYPLTKKLVRFLYNKADLLIVPADNVADMLSWQNIKTKKDIVHLGVNTDKFVKGDKNEAKKKAGFKHEDIVIGYHGRIGREKDLKTLLRAFIRIRSINDNAKLLIVGSGQRDIENIFKDKVDILFAGQQDDVIPWVQAMDIYVLPSLTETTSLSTLEAMSCEVPVISTKVGFVNDYLEEGENGFFFEKHHPYDLAKKIEILINDSSLRTRIGHNARKTVIKNFNWNTTSENIMKLINEVIDKKKKG